MKVRTPSARSARDFERVVRTRLHTLGAPAARRSLNRGHSGFAQGHHRHRRSRRPSAACTGGGCRSGCPRISLGASWRQAAAYLTTFECDLEVLRGSRCRFAKSEAICGGGRGELGVATSLPPPRSAEHSRLCSASPSGGSGVQEVLAGTTRWAQTTSTHLSRRWSRCSRRTATQKTSLCLASLRAKCVSIVCLHIQQTQLHLIHGSHVSKPGVRMRVAPSSTLGSCRFVTGAAPRGRAAGRRPSWRLATLLQP